MSKDERELSQREVSDMIKAIHRSVAGDPLDPEKKPGLALRVARHEKTLYDPEEGLVQKVQRLIDWRLKMAGGLALAVFLVELAVKKLF